MPRFYAPEKNIKGKYIYINGHEARHILNVRRLGLDDKITVFDGTGKEYTGFIKSVKQKSLTVEIIRTRIPDLKKMPELTLAQAVPRGRKMDFVIEKATELGVSRIIPIISERVSVKFGDENAKKRIERWKRIAREACKQCGRTDIPGIGDIVRFYNIIDRIDKYDLPLLACLDEKTVSLKDAVSGFRTGRVIIFIGPEGDFTPEEISMAEDASCRLVSLGGRVLRSETAGLYVLSVLNYECSR